MGEAAPLILVGAVASVFTEPDAFFYVSYQVTLHLMAFLLGSLALNLISEHAFVGRPWPVLFRPLEYVGPDSNDRGFYTVLPVQVYRWTDMPAIGFKVAAAGASLVLLGTLVVVNSAAHSSSRPLQEVFEDMTNNSVTLEQLNAMIDRLIS